jgi:hypothetical protein
MEAVMNNHVRSILRWPIYAGAMLVLIACNALGVGSSTLQQGILQLDNGIVKVQDPQGAWQPLAGDSTFQLVGTVESVEPWKVSGRTLQRNDATQIAQGIQVGDVVRVRGAVLGDDNWLAYSIEPAQGQEQTNQTQSVTIIGKITSVDPWVVNGIKLNVTSDTVINGDIQPGTLARVDILLQDDGTWEVLSISPMGDLPTTSGCATVNATVASVNGNQIQFLGWPTPVTVDTNLQPTADDNNGDEVVDLSTLKPGQQVLAIVCAAENNQFVITRLMLLNDDNDDNNEGNGGEKVLICHKPDKKGGHTISVGAAAVPAHMAHGDRMGACP